MDVENWPARQIEMRALDELVPYARNSRTHTDEQVGFRVAVVGPPGGPSLLILDDNGVGFSNNG